MLSRVSSSQLHRLLVCGYPFWLRWLELRDLPAKSTSLQAAPSTTKAKPVLALPLSRQRRCSLSFVASLQETCSGLHRCPLYLYLAVGFGSQSAFQAAGCGPQCGDGFGQRVAAQNHPCSPARRQLPVMWLGWLPPGSFDTESVLLLFLLSARILQAASA